MLGAESVIVELCKFSLSQAVEPIVGAITTKGEPRPEFLSYLPQGTQTVIFEGRGKVDLSLLKNIRSYIAQNDIKIVHCHGYKEDIYAFFLGGQTVKFATNHLWKKINFKGRIYALIDAFVLRAFDCVIAVSEEIADEMSKFKINHIQKINNGVDIERFFPREKSQKLMEKYQLSRQHLIIGMVSSLTPEKGHVFAIRALAEAIKECSNIRLIIVGDGVTANEIQTAINTYGVGDYVLTVGRQDNIPEFLSVFDVFLIASDREGLPIAMLEAMSTGKCVIASSVGEIPNVIDHRENGFLYDFGDMVGLKNAIVELSSDEILRKSCQQQAAEIVKEKYTSYDMTASYCELYKRY